jgi:hypothetical protein
VPPAIDVPPRIGSAAWDRELVAFGIDRATVDMELRLAVENAVAAGTAVPDGHDVYLNDAGVSRPAPYAVVMIERLTHRWRQETAEQEAAVAAGTLPPDAAYALTFFPPAFVAAVDGALEAYEEEIASLDPPADEEVWAAVERVVVALNDIDEAFGHHIETMTREELSEYIEDVLAQAGIDVEALLERRGTDEAAGEWRDW